MQQQSSQAMSFKCLKCSHQQCTVGEIRVAGSFWSKIFNVEARKFKTSSCNQCGYTELYSMNKSGKMENVMDFLTN
jgi:predicted nucleic-acid-binding Zn-ribbon protein